MRARCPIQHVPIYQDLRSQRGSDRTARLKSGAHTRDLNGVLWARRDFRPTGPCRPFAASAPGASPYHVHVPATSTAPTVITAIPSMSCGVNFSRRKKEAATAIIGRSIASIGKILLS
jgi:hypothetical protein